MRYPTVLASVGLTLAAPVAARGQDVTLLQPASVLAMPFDVTTNKASFQIVSRIGPSFGGAGVRTHWVFWSADCRHLVDVFIILTAGDSVVVDPRRVQGEVQSLNPPRNEPVGPVVDLGGERGVVTVTALAPDGAVTPQLVGGWTIADLVSQAAFGADALGFATDAALPDPFLLAGGILVPTFDPDTLDDSQVIVIGLEAGDDGIVPIGRPADELGGAHVCCDVAFIDDLETGFSLPTFCFACVGFAAIAGDLADAGEVPLIPPATVATSSGVLQLRSCRSGTLDGTVTPVGEGDLPQFLFAFHGQAVGPFGAAIGGKYTGVRPR